MPYRSRAQEKWAHTTAGTKALGGSAKVSEWDSASKGKALPTRLGKTKTQKATAKLARAMSGKKR